MRFEHALICSAIEHDLVILLELLEELGLSHCFSLRSALVRESCAGPLRARSFEIILGARQTYYAGRALLCSSTEYAVGQTFSG